MKRFILKFIRRGLIFGGGGPLIYSIVMYILYLCNADTTFNGLDVFKNVLSTYVMAFLVSGISIIWEEEQLGLGLAVLIHGSVLYICYLGLYLVNNWIPHNSMSVVYFSLIFISSYILIWLIIFLIERKRAKKLNSQLNKE